MLAILTTVIVDISQRRYNNSAVILDLDLNFLQGRLKKN